MYFPLISYTLITFLKVLSHFIVKIKNFMKYFKEGVLKYFKISMKFSNSLKWNILSCIPTSDRSDDLVNNSDAKPGLFGQRELAESVNKWL